MQNIDFNIGDDVLNDLKDKQQKYHEIFQQLSNTRVQFRKVKQQKDLLKIQHNGIQDELQTLRDIIRQKKEIVNQMRQEIQEKSLQLNHYENEINQLTKDKTEMSNRIQEMHSQYQRLKYEMQSKNQIISIMKQQSETNNDTNSNLQQQLQNIKTHSKQLQDQLVLITNSLSQFHLQSQSNKPLHQQIISLFEQKNKSKTNVDIIQKKNILLSEKVEQLKQTIQYYSSIILQKQEELKVMRNKSEKDGSVIKQLSQQSEQNSLIKDKQIKQISTKYSVIKSENNRMIERLSMLQDKNRILEKYSIQNMIVMVRSVLGQQLSELMIKLTQCKGEQEEIVISNEVDRLCSLIIYNQNRQSQVDVNNQQLKNKLIETQQINEILKIKISNLQKAYAHAIDDYRRSLKFKAICQTTRSTINKENIYPN